MGWRIGASGDLQNAFGEQRMRLAVLTTALVLASVAPAWASAPIPCKLVTSADAKKALGVTAGAGHAQTVGLYKSCLYASGAKVVTVLERQLSRSAFDLSAKKNPGPVAHIGGVGSDAYSVMGGKGLLVWKDGTEVSLLVSGGGGLKAEEVLGKAAAGRL
jgi:hypothetical protein